MVQVPSQSPVWYRQKFSQFWSWLSIVPSVFIATMATSWLSRFALAKANYPLKHKVPNTMVIYIYVKAVIERSVVLWLWSLWS